MSTLKSISPLAKKSHYLANTSGWSHLVWVLTAAVGSMMVAAVFAGLLQLPRNVYLIPYVVLMGAFLYSYVRWAEVDLRQHVREHRLWGLFAGVLLSIFTVQTVLMQPRSPMPQGGELLLALAWLGVIYGAMDGLLLSVLPVYATRQACTLLGWTERWPGRLAAAVLALLASMLVIGAYHLGYPEFRGPQVLLIMAGVGVQTLGYIVTHSPIAPLISHIAMHVTAVLYGLQTVSQLPPHY
jgi:hypothetical protein